MDNVKMARKLLRMARELTAKSVYRWPEIARLYNSRMSDPSDVKEVAGKITDILWKFRDKMDLADFTKARSRAVRDEDDFEDVRDYLDDIVIPVFADAAKKGVEATLDHGMDLLKEWASGADVSV